MARLKKTRQFVSMTRVVRGLIQITNIMFAKVFRLIGRNGSSNAATLKSIRDVKFSRRTMDI